MERTFREYVLNVLDEYHRGMRTYEIARVHDVPVEDILDLLAKEEQGDLEFMI